MGASMGLLLIMRQDIEKEEETKNKKKENIYGGKYFKKNKKYEELYKGSTYNFTTKIKKR